MIQEPASPTPAPASPTPPRTPTRRSVLLALLALVGCLVIATPIVLSLASSPATSAAGASAEPSTTVGPSPEPAGEPGAKHRVEGLTKGDRRGAPDGRGHGAITITAISGSDLSLTTEDGWKRTITVTADTTITKGGQTIAVGALQVGDTIRFDQKRNADGTYAVTRIVVPTPRTGGEVTSVDGDTITIKLRGGSAQVVTVTGATTYTLGRASATRADVVVGVDIVAQGTVDGTTFTALSVHVAPAQAGGEVIATTKDTVTVKDRGGATTIIHMSGSTTVKVKGKDAATIADIAVGDRVQATGRHRSDGSLDATNVHARGPKPDRHPGGKVKPSASPSTD